jgi:predicted DNA-binding transcriptional regulator AlpA
MTSRREPRLADAAEIAAEQGLTPARISGLYNERAENVFPEARDKRGRARLWDHAEVTEWFAQRPPARLREHTPPSRDPQDLLNAADASRFLGYKNTNQVTTFVRDHPGYFPDPDVVEEMGTTENPYRRQLWRVQTLLDWMATRPGRGKHAGAKRAAPALPDVPVDGDPDELLGASQAAALLGFKSVNSFSSSLSQGNLPVLEDTDAVTEKGGRRRWTRKRILEQAAQRSPRR